MKPGNRQIHNEGKKKKTQNEKMNSVEIEQWRNRTVKNKTIKKQNKKELWQKLSYEKKIDIS